VVAGRQPGARVASFVGANLPLWVMLAMAIACVTLNPHLLLTRVRDVTAPTMSLADFRVHVAANWDNLIRFFPAEFATTFFRTSEGSGHLLDIAPLGGPVGAIVVMNWIATGVALGRRARRFAGALMALAACLVTLTVFQHLATNFENYRDMTLLLPLVTVGIGFVLRLPELGATWRACLIAYAVAVAAVEYVDVAQLAGKQYRVDEYAPREQAMAETLRRSWQREDGRLRDAALYAVVGAHFPLERLYFQSAERHHVALVVMAAADFCGDPGAAVERAVGATCGRIAFAMRRDACVHVLGALAWPVANAAIAVYVIEQPCDPTRPGKLPGAELVELPLETG
jgi:hypothetical protein